MLSARTLGGITSFTSYPNGQIEDCTLNEKNLIESSYGTLIPRYGRPDMRNKELKSLSFYESGAIRSVALEEQTNLQTPMGPFPAELVTFYEDGSLDSIFPLNGQIGFGWSEREEKALAKPVWFEFPFASFTAKPLGLRFYQSGNLRSLILWPEEIVPVKTSVGVVPTRIGFKLYASGALQSLEPAAPVSVPTPVGLLKAYDNTALGVDADLNSLRFSEAGALTRLSTSGDVVVKNRVTGERAVISSRTRPGLTDEVPQMLPLVVTFDGRSISIDDGQCNKFFVIAECEFLFLPDFGGQAMSCEGDCGGGCAGCG